MPLPPNGRTGAELTCRTIEKMLSGLTREERLLALLAKVASQVRQEG